MTKSSKKIFGITIGVFIALVVGFFSLQWYIEHKISKGITEQLPKGVAIEYKKIDVNLLKNTISLAQVNIQIDSTKKSASSIQIDLNQLKISGLDYWLLWRKKQIKTDDLFVNEVFLKQKNADSSHVDFSVDNATLRINGFETNSDLLKEKLPFNYNQFSIKVDSLSYSLSPFEMLNINQLALENEELTTETISISSRYAKKEHSKKSKFERDHVLFNIQNSFGSKLRFYFINDSLSVTADSLQFNQATLSLFRNKLLPDNTSSKTPYGTLLRELPIKLGIKQVLLNGSTISYAEKVAKDIAPAPISFENWEAKIENLSNMNTEKTTAEASAYLMGNALLQLNFSFKSSDVANRFQASSNLKDFELSSLNPFLESTAKVSAKGRVEELYFTISGDASKSSGDMKMKYDNLSFSLLDQDRAGVKKIMSAIANLFTKNHSQKDGEGYRYGDIDVERDDTKSFFNYLWLNVKDGLVNTILGDGEKKG